MELVYVLAKTCILITRVIEEQTTCNSQVWKLA